MSSSYMVLLVKAYLVVKLDYFGMIIPLSYKGNDGYNQLLTSYWWLVI